MMDKVLSDTGVERGTKPVFRVQGRRPWDALGISRLPRKMMSNVHLCMNFISPPIGKKGGGVFHLLLHQFPKRANKMNVWETSRSSKCYINTGSPALRKELIDWMPKKGKDISTRL